MANQKGFGNTASLPCYQPVNTQPSWVHGYPSTNRTFMDEYESHRAHVNDNPEMFARDVSVIMNLLSAM
jgi:hypothetical protein